jgi:adenylate cyclase
MSTEPPPKHIQWLLKVTTVDEMWHKMLTQGDPIMGYFRHFWGRLPAEPRCASCHTPFAGIGGAMARVLGRTRRSAKNPRFCTACDLFYGKYHGGAEVTLTMLFVDVRGSTTLAEKMNAATFSQLMNRFYEAVTAVLVEADVFIDKFVGDEVIGLFIPGYAGPEHARRAVDTAQALLAMTGHGDPQGPWLTVGAGLHTGVAYVGTVAGVSGAGADFTALGDNVNISARLASKAGAGEVLVSDATCQAAQLDTQGLEKRDLELKGRSEPVRAWVLHAQ